jgi:hypothetical protein
LAGHPVGWVNNQYRRYIYDVSGYLESAVGDDNNLTIALESAYYYGLNITARPDGPPANPIGKYVVVSRIYIIRCYLALAQPRPV